jgi:hypothetical protein
VHVKLLRRDGNPAVRTAEVFRVPRLVQSLHNDILDEALTGGALGVHCGRGVGGRVQGFAYVDVCLVTLAEQGGGRGGAAEECHSVTVESRKLDLFVDYDS